MTCNIWDHIGECKRHVSKRIFLEYIGESVNRARYCGGAPGFYYLRKQQTLPKNKFDNILSSYAIIWDNAIVYQSLSYILNSTTKQQHWRWCGKIN